MKILKKVLLVVIIFVVIFIAIFWRKIEGPGYTAKITDKNGDIIPGSIASLEEINLGGMKQSILIRGYDKNNPILLWLHGGPGCSQMPIAYYCDKELEKEFIMVHWDQRGSGKSNTADFNEETMTYEQFISDGHQLTEYLKETYGKKKIYLLGHSWGAQLGLELAGRYPEDYYSYIGVSQVINQELSNSIAYTWLLKQIKANDAKEDLKKLEKLGNPPFTDHKEFVKFIHLVDAYGGSYDFPFTKLLQITLKAPEYILKDYWAWVDGSNRGSGKMWKEDAYSSFNAIKRYPKLDIPVYFFTGKYDYNTPLEATKEYYENLIAPGGKQLIIFEKSAHTPFLGQPEKFNKELIRVKEETLNTITIGEFHKLSKDSEMKVNVIMKFTSQTKSQKKIQSQEGVKEIFEYLISLKSDKTKVYDFKEIAKTKPAYYRVIGTIDNKYISILIGEEYISLQDTSLDMSVHIVNKDNMSTLIEMVSNYYESVKN